MAIPNTTPTKVIALASDGWKRTGFPDGSLPGDLPPSAPPEFTTSTSSFSITATITEANGATSYRVRVDSGTAVDGLTVSGLTAETPYSFQVQGVNEFGESSWSASVSITTDAASSVTPWFEDDFESGDLTKTTNGFTWSAPAGDVSVSTLNPETGTHSLKFTMGPNADGSDDTAELRFTIADTQDAPTELWLEYDFYVPSNYIHRSQASTEHHKFFALWSETYDDSSNVQFITEAWRTDDTHSYFRAICWGGACNDLAYYENRDLIVPADFGVWRKIRVHVKAANDTSARIEMWKDSQKLYDRSGVSFWGSNLSYFRKGFLLGYSNAGFAEETSFYIDNFKLWTQDPQWGMQ